MKAVYITAAVLIIGIAVFPPPYSISNFKEKDLTDESLIFQYLSKQPWTDKMGPVKKCT